MKANSQNRHRVFKGIDCRVVSTACLEPPQPLSAEGCADYSECPVLTAEYCEKSNASFGGAQELRT
jgi:hypothetical protein